MMWWAIGMAFAVVGWGVAADLEAKKRALQIEIDRLHTQHAAEMAQARARIAELEIQEQRGSRSGLPRFRL